ncbi:ribosome biogenesis/translation initiation ATPase RLI [archaeon]|nr:ribosome biogenesis/translation initiation ATPase RLI [archaeon]
MRLARIFKEKCNPERCSNYCQKLCPINRKGEECIKITNKASINEELCIGCGICHKCPFEAISIINLPESLKQQPIHQYEKNGFRLYDLPLPQKNKVVGIIGKNGIGKTTAIEILTGLLKPNLGDNASEEQILEFFKGQEIQNHFKNLKKLKISYKPQKIDQIPKVTKGTVKELLKKTDEKNQLEKVAKELEIDNILDNKIENLSGGELQRVAIAATVLKKASIYIFDEPTNYLDIKQRFKIAKFIRSLLNEKTSVLVIEHDLIILDYLSDIIHLMYGQEACYGIVSQPKTTKIGINTYLEGYLKQENVRFRDKKITFEEKSAIKSQKFETLTSYTEISKKLSNFTLTTEKGDIKKKQILGILGPNAIGKTTLMKILAGELKPDSGKVEKIKISYKPQYIKSNSTDLVVTQLQQSKKFNTSKYQSLVIEPLRLEPLFNKKIKNLSGGELQKVAIALALLREADLILLDEPSAFLDIEERLLLSKTLKNFIEQEEVSALIVDHDLLFIDYISDELMIFSGEPSISGHCSSPLLMEQGMNSFLKTSKITLRRDTENLRPRINKPNSVLDKKQISSGKYYYQ